MKIKDGILTDVTAKDLKLLQKEPQNFWKGVTIIGMNAFHKLNKLTSIIIPDGVASVEADAFSCCDNLKNVTIADSVTEIGDYAFKNCWSLKVVDISKNLKKLGVGAFCGCMNLESLYIPDGVTKIENETLAACYFLTTLRLPKNLKQISDEAFLAHSRYLTGGEYLKEKIKKEKEGVKIIYNGKTYILKSRELIYYLQGIFENPEIYSKYVTIIPTPEVDA